MVFFAMRHLKFFNLKLYIDQVRSRTTNESKPYQPSKWIFAVVLIKLREPIWFIFFLAIQNRHPDYSHFIHQNFPDEVIFINGIK